MAEEFRDHVLLRLSNNYFVEHKNMINIFCGTLPRACVSVCFVFVEISKKQVQLHIFPPTNHGP